MQVRPAAIEAVRWLVSGNPELVVVVGTGPETTSYSSSDSGSFRPFGVDLDVPLGPRACGGRAGLPLSLTVGAWLLRQVGWQGERQAVAVSDAVTAEGAAGVGVDVGRLAEQVAILCMGDGSARRSERAPGWLDERASPFDAAVARALSTADASGAAGARHRAGERSVGGRTCRLAGPGGGRSRRPPKGGWHARLTYDDAPFGVGYFVAAWFPPETLR